MDPANFIIALMRTETDALGFIPSTAIRQRFVPGGLFIIQTDRHARPRGYIIHGPGKPGRPLYIHQTVIEIDHRLRGHAEMAVDELKRRAHIADASRIVLRCRAELDANRFWQEIGFQETHRTHAGKRRGGLLIHYQLLAPFKTRQILLPAPTLRQLKLPFRDSA